MAAFKLRLKAFYSPQNPLGDLLHLLKKDKHRSMWERYINKFELLGSPPMMLNNISYHKALKLIERI